MAGYTENSIGFPVAKKTADGTDHPVIINQITMRPIHRDTADLTKWRNATRSAEASIPRRVSLYDLYEDITTTDGHVIAVWQKRVDAVTSADWQFTDKDGNPIDAINQLIDCIGFEDLLTEILNAKAWGYSMVEPTFLERNGRHEFSLFTVPRKHMRPDRGVIAKEQTGDDGVYIREGIYAKTIMEVGKAKDLGLLLSAAQYSILKRGDISDWAEFIEIFGRGIIDATWDGFDEAQREQLSESLLKMGGSGIIIRPNGTTIDIKQGTGNANGDLQEKFMSAMNKEISKVLLGSTETTESSKSSGYAQSETHQDQDEKKNETDIQFVRRILNSRFITLLEAAGFSTNGGTFTIKAKSQLSLKDSFTIEKSMALELNMPIDHNYFYEKYGMPKPTDYDAQIKAIDEAKNAENEAKQQALNPAKNDNTPGASKDKKDKKPKPVTLTDRGILSLLKSFFVQAPAQAGAQPNRSLVMTNCCGGHLTKLSLPNSEFDDDALIKRFWDAKGSLDFDVALFAYTAQTLADGLKKGWNKKSDLVQLTDIGFTYGVDDPALLTAFEQNLFRFSASKTLAEAQELNRLFRNAKDFEMFYQNAKLKTEVFNKGWLETEYNTAVLTGEAAATYTRLMGRVQTFPFWQYKTVADNKVRYQHQLLHDLILPANDPRWKRIFPPNGWNCRCYIVPRMAHEVKGLDRKAMRDRADAYFDTAEFEKAKAQGWGVNRADSGEVFTANQFYIKKFPGKAAKLLDNLGAKDYGLPSYSNAKKAATAEAPKFEGTAEQFKAAQEVFNDVPVIRDYHNRPVGLLNTFDKHTGKAERLPLLQALKETLKQADEVWINSYSGDAYDNFVSIKYYKDATLIVVSKISGGKVYEVTTWFPLAEKKEVIETYRRGLLIFSKK